ncbi:MAG TPA: vitamin K epoxide reductase family protein [Methylomirabilota bacterium]|nr:vitamin K epoxide reductase family protein [Methylomirabilota bacterium]
MEGPRRDWLIAAVAAVGLAVSAYLTVTKLTRASALFCTAGSGCDVIQASPYALFLGVPTALWGALLYAAIGILAALGLSDRAWLRAFLLSVAGVAFSAYLTFLSVFVIRAVCAYCLASAAAAVALFGLLLARRPASGGRRSPTRPARVATLGALVAMGTVLVGAFIFAGNAPEESAAYREALARHLSTSGAIFYGAYW